MNIIIVPLPSVDEVWPLISERMQDGCNKTGGGMSSGEMWQMCRSGQAFLIIGHDESIIHFASVWRFENWASGTVFRCVGLCGKNISEWFVLLYDFAKHQARLGGTERLVAEGRRGLPRLAKRLLQSKVKRLYEAFEVD